MYRFAILPERRHYDVFGDKVALCGGRRAYADGRVGKPYMQAVRVRCGIYGDCFYAHFAAASYYANRYFTAIRYQ
jgi:hypothetical protein